MVTSMIKLGSMTRIEILNGILASKIVAIIRMDNPEKVIPVARALHKGGIKAIEITMGTPNALELIRELSQIGGVIPGVGTIIDVDTCKLAIQAGAEFVVTPVSKPEVIQMAHQHDKPIFSGAFTPGEILQAYEWGADVVKVFPADYGMKYFKALRGPLPQIPMMPTGGVTKDNILEWFGHGACAVGMGTTLMNKQAVEQNDFELVTRTARSFVEMVK